MREELERMLLGGKTVAELNKEKPDMSSFITDLVKSGKSHGEIANTLARYPTTSVQAEEVEKLLEE